MSSNNQPYPQDAPSVGWTGDVVHRVHRFTGGFDGTFSTACQHVTLSRGDVTWRDDLVTCPACLEAMLAERGST